MTERPLYLYLPDPGDEVWTSFPSVLLGKQFDSCLTNDLFTSYLQAVPPQHMDCPTLTFPLVHCRLHKEGHWNHWARRSQDFFIQKPMEMTFSAFTGLLLTSETQFFCTVEAMGGGKHFCNDQVIWTFCMESKFASHQIRHIVSLFFLFFAWGSSLCCIPDATEVLWGSQNPCLAGGCWTKELPARITGDCGLKARQHSTTDTSAQRRGPLPEKLPTNPNLKLIVFYLSN